MVVMWFVSALAGKSISEKYVNPAAAHAWLEIPELLHNNTLFTVYVSQKTPREAALGWASRSRHYLY
jgi:hypothetical protein